MGFPALFVIHVIAHRTNPAGGHPFVKSPFSDPAFTILAADRADIVVRKVLKGCAGGDAVVVALDQTGAVKWSFIPPK